MGLDSLQSGLVRASSPPVGSFRCLLVLDTSSVAVRGSLPGTFSRRTRRPTTDRGEVGCSSNHRIRGAVITKSTTVLWPQTWSGQTYTSKGPVGPGRLVLSPLFTYPPDPRDGRMPLSLPQPKRYTGSRGSTLV